MQKKQPKTPPLFSNTQWTRFGSEAEFSPEAVGRMPLNWQGEKTVTTQKWVTAGHNASVNIDSGDKKKYARGVHMTLPSVASLLDTYEGLEVWDQDEETGKKPKNYVAIKPTSEPLNMAFGGLAFIQYLNQHAEWEPVNWKRPK